MSFSSLLISGCWRTSFSLISSSPSLRSQIESDSSFPHLNANFWNWGNVMLHMFRRFSNPGELHMGYFFEITFAHPDETNHDVFGWATFSLLRSSASTYVFQHSSQSSFLAVGCSLNHSSATLRISSLGLRSLRCWPLSCFMKIWVNMVVPWYKFERVRNFLGIAIWSLLKSCEDIGMPLIDFICLSRAQRETSNRDKCCILISTWYRLNELTH